MKKLEVKKAIVIPDGKHTGTIVKLEEREEPHNYLDVTVSVDGIENGFLRASYPSGYVSENMAIGRLLERFGAKLEHGAQIDPAKILKPSMRVQFRKTTITGKDGNEYPEMVRDSLSPVKE